MSPFFDFERDFVDSLRCIPMRVRYNLDRCGIKLKLHHWHHLTEEERRFLVALPCDGEANRANYRKTLREMVQLRSREVPKDLPVDPSWPWQGEFLPAETVDQAKRVEVSLSDEQWRSLSEIQRFVLVKLSRPGHENRNFIPALREFGLWS
ncbi:MAG: nitrate reductase associated protein [Cyanobacteria bacterium P01_D01_bin.73]